LKNSGRVVIITTKCFISAFPGQSGWLESERFGKIHNSQEGGINGDDDNNDNDDYDNNDNDYE
jgi:hypothetical protein